ncbi:hypothetical protein PhCBS80983_g06044 [Powellomyces hirtus]|uniref:Uncharacterized protein n=1 Tax=Powellomyces hirtus TaxID=109895 RepID=A0A507DRM7_9FUNG|nr:hypothetical protein PhCBS80983_g06044 [Powellomyces hirtus]
MSFKTLLFGTLLAVASALPSSHLLRARQSPLLPVLPDQCSDIFGTDGQDAFTRNLFQTGDGWLQGFIAPISGSLCSMSFAVRETPINPANASLSLYAAEVTREQITAGGIDPLVRQEASTIGDRLVFTFCGAQSVSLVEELTYNFAITFTAAALPNIPLTIAYQRALNSSGNFFGPSFTPVFNVVNEGIVFNLTTAGTTPSCDGEGPATSIEASTSTVLSTAIVESTTTVAETTQIIVSTTTAAPIETTSVAEATTQDESTAVIPGTTDVEATTAGETSTAEFTIVTSVSPVQTTSSAAAETTVVVSSTFDATTLPIFTTIGETTAVESTEVPEATSSSVIVVPSSTQSPAEPSSTKEPEEPCDTVTTTTTTTTTATPSAVPECTGDCTTCRAAAWKTCPNAKAYTSCVKSPTLSLCYRLACAPHQRSNGYLKQCEQLEIWARYTHDDLIPDKW